MKGPKVSLGRNSFLIRRRAELSTGPSGRSQPRGQRFGHRRLDRRKGTAIARVDPKTDPPASVLVGDKADIRQKMRRGIGQSSQHSLRLTLLAPPRQRGQKRPWGDVGEKGVSLLLSLLRQSSLCGNAVIMP